MLGMLAAGELLLSLALHRTHAAIAATQPNITREQIRTFFA